MTATKTILIVDDQPEVRELVQVTLEEGAYKLLCAANGDEALALAKRALPDLMLLDIQMPGGQLDGLQVCRLLKEAPTTRRIHIIMLTAKGQDWDRQLGLEAGADDYFVKPFSPLELMMKVDAVLS